MRMHLQNHAGALVTAACGLITTLNLACARPLQPEVLYSFQAGPYGPNADLVQASDGSLYGTTIEGGTGNCGTVFKASTNGSWTTLLSFTGANGRGPSPLTLGRDGNFYGTTMSGGSSDVGTVFRVTTNGVLTTLVSCTGNNGAFPASGLTIGRDGDFYGTTMEETIDGSSGNGTVFRVTTNGVLTTVIVFDGTNGIGPWSLTLGRDGSFYGTASGDGEADAGRIFRLTTNGDLTTLVQFGYSNVAGAGPGRLTLGDNGNFYGTTRYGGGNGYGYGTIFRVSTNGLITTLVSNVYPNSSLTLGQDGSFYGTTGRTYGSGTVFRVTTNGVLTTLVSLGSYDLGDRLQVQALTLGGDGNLNGTWGFKGGVFQVTTNGLLKTLADFSESEAGQDPVGLAVGADGNFYGTTHFGGTSGQGTVFRLSTNGVLTTLVSFDGTNGAYPYAGLTPGRDGNLYGTTEYGGSNWADYPDYPYSGGTVFQVTTTGVLTTLVSFIPFDPTNGAEPYAGLTLGHDGNLYGTTVQGTGNSYGYGTVFRVTTNGALTTLVSFNGTNGMGPYAGLTQGSDGNLYGTTDDGGTNWTGAGSVTYGTAFRVTTNGALTTLVSFDPRSNGVRPKGLIVGSDGNFYGTTESGTVFQLTTNGVLATLVSFPDGWYSETALTLGRDGNFYGTTADGGAGGGGVIFRLRRGVSIQSFAMATNGFQLNTLNVGGSGWVVLQSSSDVAHWTPIQTNGTAAAQQLLDPTALNKPRQFYRVRQQ